MPRVGNQLERASRVLTPKLGYGANRQHVHASSDRRRGRGRARRGAAAPLPAPQQAALPSTRELGPQGIRQPSGRGPPPARTPREARAQGRCRGLAQEEGGTRARSSLPLPASGGSRRSGLAAMSLRPSGLCLRLHVASPLCVWASYKETCHWIGGLISRSFTNYI